MPKSVREKPDQKLAAETKKRQDAEKELGETEDNNRRLQAEAVKLTMERDELKFKLDNITAILSPQKSVTNGPTTKKPRLDAGQIAAPGTTAAATDQKNGEEDNVFVEIIVCTDNDMEQHSGFDLLDLKQFRREKGAKVRVRKTTTVADLYSAVAQNFGMDGRDFRLCQFDDINAKREWMRRQKYLGRLRPHFFLKPDAEDNQCGQAQSVEALEKENLIYIELGQPDSTDGYRLMPYDEDRDFLFFLKFYNHERKLTEYKGTLAVNVDATWATYLPEIRRRLELPSDAHLNAYVEIAPDAVQPHRNLNRTVRESQDANRIVDGGILVVEVADNVSSENNIQYYFNRRFNRIDVEAHVNMDGFRTSVNSPAPPVKGTIGLDWPMQKVVNWLGKEIDFNVEQLLLWTIAQRNEKPSLSLTRNQFNLFTVKELLSLNGSTMHDPRLGRTYKLFYTKLPIPFLALESRQQLKVQALYDKFQTAKLTLFPEKNGTVQSTLDEAKRDFKFSETGTGELRLVHCGAGASCYRVFAVIKNNVSMAEIKAKYLQSAFSLLRVEEIPSDQKEIARDEKLFPVAHYDKACE